ncbi:aldo/keto reductase [Kribbella sp. NPDC050124]|uniref:aldo/keto reductase n=1 Tax=Kribbella sp. NPDC050124 TaxID=3364114 RepID=UPI0037A7C9FE
MSALSYGTGSATTSTWRRRCHRRTAGGRRRRVSISWRRSPAITSGPASRKSLRVSGLDAFDVVQFHVWSDDDWSAVATGWRRTRHSRTWASSGSSGCRSTTTNPENALALIDTCAVDTVQVIYNVFSQQPERLLPACQEHGVGVIVRVALDEGGLTGRITAGSTFPDGDFRNAYFRGDRPAQVEEHVNALVADLGIETDQLPDIALRYVLDNPAVSTVIAGMRSVRNVERNAATSDG